MTTVETEVWGSLQANAWFSGFPIG